MTKHHLPQHNATNSRKMKRPAKQPQKPLTLVQLRRVVPWGISAATLRWFVPAFADGYPATLLSNAGGAGRCAVVGGKSGLECWECTAPRLVRLLENHKQDIPAMLHRAAKMVAGSPFADGVDGWSYCRGLGVWGFTGLWAAMGARVVFEMSGTNGNERGELVWRVGKIALAREWLLSNGFDLEQARRAFLGGELSQFGRNGVFPEIAREGMNPEQKKLLAALVALPLLDVSSFKSV